MSSEAIELRRKVAVDPEGRVTLTFVNDLENHDVGGFFVCAFCEDYLLWSPEQSLWYCKECGNELTPEEGSVLTARYMRVLKGMRSICAERSGGRWRWVRSLLHLFTRET